MDDVTAVALLVSGKHCSTKTQNYDSYQSPTVGVQVYFSHIHREGNRPANFMACRGLQTDTMPFFEATSIPRYFLALVRMDQLSYSNFKFRLS